MRMLRSRWTRYGLFAVVLLTVPAIFTRVPFYTMSSAVLMGLFALGALGLVPLTGHANQISLGQAAFYGIGGYASAVLTIRQHVSPLVAILVGGARRYRRLGWSGSRSSGCRATTSPSPRWPSASR